MHPDGGKAITPFPNLRHAAGHFVLNGVLFLAAVVAGCALLGRCLPFPEVPLVCDKIEYLARHGDEYDVLFLGSSRVHSQVMPAIFDRVAGENGVTVKSFNAGVAGMVSPEDDYVLEEILRRPHQRLRWIFIEISRLGTGVAREETERFGYWHDTAHLLLIARRLRGEALERLARNPGTTFGARYAVWKETGELLCGHVSHWWMRAINLGRGAEVLQRRMNEANHRYVPAKSLGKNRDGWMSMDRKRRPMPEAVRKKFEQTYADRLERPPVKERGDPVSQSALERLLSTASRGGATPVLLIPPATGDSHFYPTEARERELTILDFSDVRQYAGLFELKHRFDVEHLNTAGSELFSQMLALRFVELVKKQRATP